MANMNVSYEDMESAANRLKTGKDDLASQLLTLRNFISTLVSSGFVTDQASSAFNETYDSFNQAANSTIGNLDTLANNLQTTANTLRDVDSQLAAGMRG